MKDNSTASAGWSILDWRRATSIARATFYTLAQRPRFVKLGRRTVVIECPREYLARIAAEQREAA
jgi:hypothetical protein